MGTVSTAIVEISAIDGMEGINKETQFPIGNWVSDLRI